MPVRILTTSNQCSLPSTCPIPFAPTPSMSPSFKQYQSWMLNPFIPTSYLACKPTQIPLSTFPALPRPIHVGRLMFPVYFVLMVAFLSQIPKTYTSGSPATVMITLLQDTSARTKPSTSSVALIPGSIFEPLFGITANPAPHADNPKFRGTNPLDS